MSTGAWALEAMGRVVDGDLVFIGPATVRKFRSRLVDDIDWHAVWRDAVRVSAADPVGDLVVLDLANGRSVIGRPQAQLLRWHSPAERQRRTRKPRRVRA